ncbi:MAG TPA: hypothetical protein VHV83_02305 [Armatimonadota bacterium]|nr:hypothetical protein [Armatimonadota bacterium]
MRTDNTYDRDTLYHEVWADPVTVVAKRYEVSDVAIHKACKRLQVPVPPRGYWAKLRAGQDVTREPLPPFEGPAPKQKIVNAPTKRRLDTGVTPPATVHPDDGCNSIFAICDAVAVAEELTDPHPLIAQDQAAREAWARWEQESKKPAASRGAFSSLSAPYQMNEQRMDITVVDDDVPRAYRLLNTIFHAVERMGGTVRLEPKKQHIHVVLLEESIRIRLKSQAEGFTLVIDEYHAPRKHWRDTAHKRLENELGAFLRGLYTCAVHLKTAREEQRIETVRQREVQRQQYLRGQQQREELARFQGFEQVAMDWQRARMLEGFVAALEQKALQETDPRKRESLEGHISWAKRKIAWVDPLIAAEDPLLGVRQHAMPEDEKVILESVQAGAWFGYAYDEEEDEEDIDEYALW